MNDSVARAPADGVDRLLAVVFERFAATGEWPLVDKLRHELDQSDDDIDVMALGREMDPNLGRVGLSHGDRASLTIHGIARCPGSGAVLQDLLRTMHLAYQRFRAEGTAARLSSEIVRDELGFSPLQIRRVYELMWPLPGIGGGSGTSSEDWEREITADVTVFKRTATIDDLIAATPRAHRSFQPTLPPSAAIETIVDLGPAAPAVNQLSELHPRVSKVAGSLFRDGHYAQASFEAFKALEVELRKRSGLDLSGRELAEKALGGGSPRLRLRRHAGRTGADEQEGLRFLFMGVMQALRNPRGHEVGTNDRAETLEELAVASLLMRRLEKSVKSKPRLATEADRSRKRPNVASRRARDPDEQARPRSPRVIVLAALSDIAHRQARTSEILDLKLRELADQSGVSFVSLQDALVDLLAEGLVEPFAATMGQSAEQGACRITGAGLRELARSRGEA
jgi:uncharacterized protein (TIGR02391 family)